MNVFALRLIKVPFVQRTGPVPATLSLDGCVAIVEFGRKELHGWPVDQTARRWNCRAADMVEPFGQFAFLLRIMCMVSMPAMRIRAIQKDLNPSIDRVIRLMARWSCSTMLFKYLHWRSRIPTQASALTLSMTAVFASLDSRSRLNWQPFVPRLESALSAQAQQFASGRSSWLCGDWRWPWTLYRPLRWCPA